MPLEQTVLEIIRTGRNRCGRGFGKYPLGILDSDKELLPLVSDSYLVIAALKDFEDRLNRD